MKTPLMIIILLGLIGCERFEIGTKDPGPMIIQKTKQNYNDFLSISLTADKSKVSSYPGPTDIDDKDKPIKLANDYQTSLIWLDYVYTDIRIEDWERILDSIHANNIQTSIFLYNHIIDFDPFIEFYVDYERIVDYLPDTVFLNKIIKQEELLKYFERVKQLIWYSDY